MKHFKCEFYEVDAPDKCCLFCKHCQDVFWDHANGPYAFGCRLTFKDDIGEILFGWNEDCENFEEDDE